MGKNRKNANRRVIHPSDVQLTKEQETLSTIIESLKGQNRIREAADYSLRFFQTLPVDDNPYHPLRYALLSCWTYYFTNGELDPTEKDFRTLERIAHNGKEAKLIRVCSCEALFSICMEKENRADAAYWLSETKRIGQQASGIDRSMLLCGKHAVLNKNPSAGDIIDFIMDNERPISIEPTRIFIQSDEKFQSVEVFSRLNKYGGKVCDTCGKSAQQCSDINRLLTCSRCLFMYYCSETCQKKAWEEGHEKYCRAPGKFKVGDYVKVKKPRHQKISDSAATNFIVEQPFVLTERERGDSCKSEDGSASKNDYWTLGIPDKEFSTLKFTGVPTCDLIQLRPLK